MIVTLNAKVISAMAIVLHKNAYPGTNTRVKFLSSIKRKKNVKLATLDATIYIFLCEYDVITVFFPLAFCKKAVEI